MKNKQEKSKKLMVSIMLFAIVAFGVSSCSKTADDILNSNDSQNVNGESASDSYSDDASDMSNVAVGSVSSNAYVNGGRLDGTPGDSLKAADDRFSCATFTIVKGPNSTKDAPKGTITIDFGTSGCKDSKGVTRKGQIIVAYTGRRYVSGSTIVTTFKDYYHNDVKVEGTHTLTNTQASLTANPKFTVAIVGGKVTFSDGKTITREQNFTREWQRASNPTQDKIVISAGGTASGSNKDGKTYAMLITTDLVYSRACAISNKVFIPVSGIKTLTADSKAYTMDFGTGDCDNKVTISVNGKSKVIEASAAGN